MINIKRWLLYFMVGFISNALLDIYGFSSIHEFCYYFLITLGNRSEGFTSRNTQELSNLADVSATRLSAKAELTSLFSTKSFLGRWNHNKAGSVCQAVDQDGLCTCWEVINVATATPEDDYEITKFSVRCSQGGGISELVNANAQGAIVFQCKRSQSSHCEVEAA
ncbi:hypothetical protein K431DRAFT_141812 [Polychaeton citri CBS 116435]|uniref:Uncharacterized protein n=1 Tax=Polychaeton citri CBS 116435 TaxID=1314669 RepID=A0A9P4UMK6_9PEZI|nr:hypothetical protein K431DRAFT_141812 [Polychaeton citri CBS 116435]